MARVTGGDRLVVAGKRYLLYGIDAPESNQPCFVDDKLWACGPVATRKLAELTDLEPVTRVERTRMVFAVSATSTRRRHWCALR